jgi:hypothetical protein
MIARFFQQLEGYAVEYLLISGQATILYGAATFSEDVDLWLNPAQVQVERFCAALRACGAQYYKLTPPLTLDNMTRGHGFHYVLPSGQHGAEVYLDVMGRPPRVGSFTSAVARACWIDTDWGRIHTVGIRELVELKKTQRAEDYPIISRLVLLSLQKVQSDLTREDLTWAMDNIFSLSELRTLLQEHPAAVEGRDDLPPTLGQALGQLLDNGEITDTLEDELDAWLQRRVAVLRQADRRYWRDIIADLRNLRASGGLMAEGSAV